MDIVNEIEKQCLQVIMIVYLSKPNVPNSQNEFIMTTKHDIVKNELIIYDQNNKIKEKKSFLSGDDLKIYEKDDIRVEKIDGFDNTIFLEQYIFQKITIDFQCDITRIIVSEFNEKKHVKTKTITETNNVIVNKWIVDNGDRIDVSKFKEDIPDKDFIILKESYDYYDSGKIKTIVTANVTPRTESKPGPYAESIKCFDERGKKARFDYRTGEVVPYPENMTREEMIKFLSNSIEKLQKRKTDVYDENE